MPWLQNQRGGIYRYGAAYSLQKRIQIILTYISLGNIAATSVVERVSYNCVSKLLDQFQQNATLMPQFDNKFGKPKKIISWMEVYIEAVIIIYPTIFIREVIQMLTDDFGLHPNDVPSCSVVKRLLAKLHITRKRCIHVARERFSPYIIQRRQEYIRWRMTVNPSRMYFFDETAFTSETDQREYGRRESGYQIASYRNKNPIGAKCSVLGLCGYTEGFMQAIPVVGNFDTLIINHVTENQLLPLLPRDCFLICDNASIHNETDLARILSLKNITLVKLPAYSYDLNPIEMAFGLAKAKARQTPGALEENILIAVIDAFLSIPAQSIRNFYRKSWKIAR